MITSSTQILVPKCHFPLEESRFLGETVDSRASSGHIQDERGTRLVPPRKKGRWEHIKST